MATYKEQRGELLKCAEELGNQQVDCSEIDEQCVNICKKLEADYNKMTEIRETCQKMYEERDDLNLYERTEADLLTAYTLNSLYFAYVKITGEDDTHVKKQLARVKASMNRLKKIQAVANRPETTDVVAKRMIHRALAVKRKHEDTSTNETEQDELSKTNKP